MSYATVEDWLKAEASQAHIADIDGDGEPDQDKIAEALADASAEMDGWLASRVEIPVTDAKALPTLRVHAITIASYHLARTANALTEEIAKRYENAIAYFKAVARGAGDLPLTKTDSLDDGGGDVQLIAEGRLFTRDSLRDW